MGFSLQCIYCTWRHSDVVYSRNKQYDETTLSFYVSLSIREPYVSPGPVSLTTSFSFSIFFSAVWPGHIRPISARWFITFWNFALNSLWGIFAIVTQHNSPTFLLLLHRHCIDHGRKSYRTAHLREYPCMPCTAGHLPGYSFLWAIYIFPLSVCLFFLQEYSNKCTYTALYPFQRKSVYTPGNPRKQNP